MPNLRYKRRIATISIALFTLSSGSVIAYRHLFRRPGEQAIALIPADALMVATLDTNPAPSQVALFNQLRDTYKSSGLENMFDDLFNSSPDGKPSPLGQLRPFVTDNYAVAYLSEFDFNSSAKSKPDSKEMPDLAVFVGISDLNGAQNWLKTNGTPANLPGFEAYEVKSFDGVALIHENYLIIAPNLASLQKVTDVIANRKPSLLTSDAYKQARESLEPDSNLMLFFSPKFYQSLYAQAKETTKVGKGQSEDNSPELDVFKSLSWAAMGATVREDGLKMQYQAPLDATKSKFLQLLAQVKPLDANALKALPTGAYMVSSYAQPAGYWDAAEQMMTEDPGTKKDFNKGIADFEKETGLSVDRDLTNAFKGATTVALYPDAANPDGYLDGVLYLTDENNGDPAALAQKVRTMIEKKTSGKNGSQIGFVTRKQGETTVVSLDPHSQNVFKTALVNDFDPKPVQYIPAKPNYAVPHTRRKKSRLRTASYLPVALSSGTTGTPKAQERGAYLKGKTVVWAIVGRSVILATSRPMLDKALASVEGRAPSLATDPNSAELRNTLGQGSQTWMWIGLGQIMQKFRPFLETSFKDSDPSMTDDMVNIFGGANAGMFASGSYDGKIGRGTLFYPLDWQRAIQLGGKFSAEAKKNKAKNDGSRPPVL